MAVSTALDVANELIQKANDKGFVVSNMKLQKLVYFAHGYYMAIHGDPLFDEGVEAWRYGPVVSELYHSFKQYHSNPIPSAHYLVTETEPVNDDVSKLIDAVVDSYAAESAGKLVDITHLDGTPWKETYDPMISNKVIANDLIKRHFENILS